MKDALCRHFRKSLVFVFLSAVFTVSAQATTVSYYLDQSNVTALPDNSNYLMVTIDDNGGSGIVDFWVDTVPGAFTAGTNFGIQSFGFNFTGATAPNAVDFIVPNGWNVDVPPPNNQDGFGDFDYIVSNGGNNRQDPLHFSIATDEGLSSFFALSSGNAGQGNVAFAAHVAGFTVSGSSVTSAWFGGSTPVPIPAAAWLFGAGLLGLAGVARRGRRTA